MNQKKLILVVDDEQKTLQSLMANIISRRRTMYEVVVAIDGLEALQIMKERDVDLLILDLHMEQCSGIEVCQEINNDEELKEKGTEILISSGYIDDSMEDQLNNLGVKRYLKKPYPIEVLIDEIDAILKHKSLHS